MKCLHYKLLISQIILTALAVISVFVISSCTDTLGTDPDVRSTLISDSQHNEDTTHYDSETRFSISSLWNLSELFKDGMMGKSINWGNRINEKMKKFVVDTANSKMIIWIEYYVESTIKDNENVMHKRHDRVISFNLKVDSLILDLSNPNKDYGFLDNVQSSIQIKDLKQNYIAKCEKNEIGFFINIRRNINTGNIEGFFNFDLNPFYHFETFKFQGNFEGIIPQ
ncbi:MAG: hypothetical protein A2X64_06415 [Ignavibacteria bacterium GWF2_33_9]|nr:MAG: hypothetical protein A2X64_06415 [Ignavibacteria bacterium GWF2_33_9]